MQLPPAQLSVHAFAFWQSMWQFPPVHVRSHDPAVPHSTMQLPPTHVASHFDALPHSTVQLSPHVFSHGPAPVHVSVAPPDELVDR